MNSKILISGGAGFIGSNLASQLVRSQYDVVVLDNLSEQVHGKNPELTSFLYKSIKNKVVFINGDIRNKSDWEKALKGVDIVIHLAAETGTGQSMYDVTNYCDVNITGTALFLDYIVHSNSSIKKVILASSRAVYGEGKYYCKNDGYVFPKKRNDDQLQNGIFDPVCPICYEPIDLAPTDEDSKMNPTSIYGITKLAQEQLLLNTLIPLNIPAVVLRFQNVYGPGQSLLNPYTGILSIFSSLIKNNRKINIFEDGLESRDFVYISDVINATQLVIENSEADFQIFNVGSGESTTVQKVVNKLSDLYENSASYFVSGNYRVGDIRHNLADISKIKKILGYSPQYSFEKGVKHFSEWVKKQNIDSLDYEYSLDLLRSKKLFK